MAYTSIQYPPRPLDDMDLLQRDFNQLREVYPSATMERRSDGSALIAIPDMNLPAGWNTEKAGVIYVAPVGYPAARPDCFWTDATLRLAHGGMPANSGHNANHGGPEPLLWFSYHPSSWNPNTDNLLTFT